MLFRSVGGDPATAPHVVEGFDRFLTETRENAGRITSVATTRPSGSLMGLVQVPPVAGPTWKAVMARPTLTERLEALCDPAIRADLIEEGQRKGLLYDPRHVYPMGTGAVPDYALQGEPSLAVLAERAGVHPVEVVIDRLIESEGHEQIGRAHV